jgi:prepilin-type N-terminal cleavage/methylation domain-containing protein
VWYSNKYGFTLIEIVVAIVLVGLLATIVVPRFWRMQPSYERKQFISELNMLVRLAWQQAIALRKTTRLLFDLTHQRVSLQLDTGKQEHGERLYTTMQDTYVPTSYQWPERFQIKDFYIDGEDEMHRPGRVKTEEVWFFVFSDGTTQELILNVFDIADKSESDAGSRFSLVLSPFSTTFITHDIFQKP